MLFFYFRGDFSVVAEFVCGFDPWRHCQHFSSQPDFGNPGIISN